MIPHPRAGWLPHPIKSRVAAGTMTRAQESSNPASTSAAGGGSGTGRLIEPVLAGHGDIVKAVAITPDGRIIASASKDGTVRRWDARTGAPFGEPMRGHRGGVWALAISTDGATIASGGDDGPVRTWETATRAPLTGTPLGVDTRIQAPAFSPPGPRADRALRPDTAVVISPDGSRVATASQDRTVRLWGSEPAPPIGPTLTGADQVARIAVDRDQSELSWTGQDGVLRR